MKLISSPDQINTLLILYLHDKYKYRGNKKNWTKTTRTTTGKASSSFHNLRATLGPINNNQSNKITEKLDDKIWGKSNTNTKCQYGLSFGYNIGTNFCNFFSLSFCEFFKNSEKNKNICHREWVRHQMATLEKPEYVCLFFLFLCRFSQMSWWMIHLTCFLG
jgi:hypothetical protein